MPKNSSGWGAAIDKEPSGFRASMMYLFATGLTSLEIFQLSHGCGISLSTFGSFLESLKPFCLHRPRNRVGRDAWEHPGLEGAGVESASSQYGAPQRSAVVHGLHASEYPRYPPLSSQRFGNHPKYRMACVVQPDASLRSRISGNLVAF